MCLFEGVCETHVIQTPGAWRKKSQAAVHATTLAASAPSAASVDEFKATHFRLKHMNIETCGRPYITQNVMISHPFLL